MAGGVKRAQGRKFETHLNTRQDRNAYLTDGGTWTWNSGTLSWSGTVVLRRGGLGDDLIAANSLAGIVSEGHIVYMDVDRDAANAANTASAGTLTLADALNNTDERIILGVRGADGKLYLRDGTIFSDGDSKTLGSLNSATDRADIIATTATVIYSTVFSYLEGSSQLTVYVGGILQELGIHYTEAGPPATFVSDITFLAPYVPTAGERISCLNIVGGQGPAGVTSLFEAYLISGIVELTNATSPVHLWRAGDNAALAVGEDAVLANAKAVLETQGALSLRAGDQGLSIRDSGLLDDWKLVPDQGSEAILLFNESTGEGVSLDKAGQGMAFGAWSGGTYPTGSWASVDPIRWDRFTVSVPAVPTLMAATGYTDIIAVSAAVFDSVSARFSTWQTHVGSNAAKKLSVTYDAAGNIYLSALPDGTGNPGLDLQGQTAELLVFYKG
jgi:hypothetical protein